MGSLRESLGRRSSNPLSMDEWADMFTFGGVGYPFLPTGTLSGKEEKVAPTFAGYVQGAYSANGPVFACMLARLMLFSEVRFQYRKRENGRAGELFGASSLKLLEEPWVGGTTGKLAARAIQDVDLAGNSFIAKRNGRLARLRPDWTRMILGSPTGDEIDAEVVGYMYEPKGSLGEDDPKPMVLLPHEVAHFAPIPDPIARFRGMSWLTPVLREIMGDKAATKHQLKFFENGATPNLVVKFDPSVQQEAFDTWRKLIDEGHRGASKAYKTLYLGGGADATVVGANMKQIDFTQTRGSGETRIAAAAGVPPVIVGLSEGLKAATYSNYQQATRRFADGTMRPLWREFCAAVAPLVAIPANSELWYDDRDIAFLKEDAKDAVEVQNKRAETISKLINAGYEADSVVEAIEADDWSLLKHTGYVSVQMWKPGTEPGESTHVPK